VAADALLTEDRLHVTSEINLREALRAKGTTLAKWTDTQTRECDENAGDESAPSHGAPAKSDLGAVERCRPYT
jgi:hypothetical protein